MAIRGVGGDGHSTPGQHRCWEWLIRVVGQTKIALSSLQLDLLSGADSGPVWSTTVPFLVRELGFSPWSCLSHRAAGRAAAHGELIDAVGTAYHPYDSVSCIVSSCCEGSNAWRTSRQRVLPVIITAGGRTSWHRAAGRVAVHGEHRGRGYRLSSLRQGVVRRGIVPPVGWKRMENIEAEGAACLHYDRGSYLSLIHI